MRIDRHGYRPSVRSQRRLSVLQLEFRGSALAALEKSRSGRELWGTRVQLQARVVYILRDVNTRFNETNG
jgi:hypothetical protein